MEPTVSVVMPSYNGADHIALAISSVLQQTFRDLELLVVDDCSTDDSVAIIQRFSDDERVRLLRQTTNMGAAAARNRAISAAQGRYIAFLDADDLWSESKLETQLEQMKINGWGFTYTEYELIDESGKRIGGSGPLPESVTYDELLRGCIIQNSTAIYDTQATRGKVQCPPLPKRQDFGLFLAALRRTPRAHLVVTDDAQPLCSYRQVAGSVSSNKFKNIRHQWNIYFRTESLGLLKSVQLMGHWFVYAGLKSRRRKQH